MVLNFCNLQTCFKIRVNEAKIPEVLNDHLVAIKKVFKDKKKKKKSFSLKKVVNDMQLIFLIYKAVHFDECSTSLIIIRSENMSMFYFFELYISAQYLEIIA